MLNGRFKFASLSTALKRLIRNDHLVLVTLALVAGAAAGGAVIGFREAIAFVQLGFLGTDSERLVETVRGLPWWQILLAPVVGGLIVGGLTHFLMPDRRPQAVADVIEASALRGGWMSSRVGLAAAAISAVSIGTGASVGREGPAIHLGASLSGWLGRRLRLPRSLNRTLLGCGVASAVAASFNAPIAGALFASEVVIGHYALKALAPVVIASVAGTAISQSWFGDYPAFALHEIGIASFWEFPAFALLGVTAGIAAIVFMRATFFAAELAKTSPVPAWGRPAVAGFGIGVLALALPEVLGVGYDVTESALLVALPLWMLITVGLAKIAATALCLGWGFGGGVFSPSLVIGAMVGGAFGTIATEILPHLSSGPAAYTIVGMGAMAAAVLGAPISTTLIVFEMTGDYALTLGVMIAVVIASEITQQFYGQSFFHVQLRERGIDLKGGFETEIMRAVRIRDVATIESDTVSPDVGLPELRKRLLGARTGEVFVIRDTGELYGVITLADISEAVFDPAIDDLIRAGDVADTHPPVLSQADDLESALSLLAETGEDRVAVVEDPDTMTFKGCVTHAEVMAAYNRELLKSRHEEHGSID